MKNKHYNLQFMELLVKLGIKTVDDLKKFKDQAEKNKTDPQPEEVEKTR